MMSAVIFLIVCLILLDAGWNAARILLPRESLLLRLALSFPLAALLNTVIIFVLTVLQIPLAWWSILPGLVIFIAASHIVSSRVARGGDASVSRGDHLTISPLWKNVLTATCLLLLVNIFLFITVHSVLFPSLTVDSYTNWTMRAQVSFTDRSMAFDQTEVRGVAKPQYPFLVHGLQITANQGQRIWNDRIANTITLLLSLSSFAAAYLLVRKLRGPFTALLAVTAIASMPLMSIQLAQGYGDVHLIGYLMLGFLTLVAWKETADQRWLWLSALMTAAAMWTKLEGLWFAFVPWALLVFLLAPKRTHALLPIITPLLLFIPFSLLMLTIGLPISHSEIDAAFAWQGALIPFLQALFTFGSFGIAWYVLPVAAALIVLNKNTSWESRAYVLWGALVVAELAVIYLFTPNARFLINSEAFFRQALAPAAVLILACAMHRRHPQEIDNQSEERKMRY
ncbi:MAG: hypothetical protein HOO67_03755 [Candidatus Peribacteraceae bacterium]|nr:hypothetical protein [Candidatus Peribacteraceae bacterium]